MLMFDEATTKNIEKAYEKAIKYKIDPNVITFNRLKYGPSMALSGMIIYGMKIEFADMADDIGFIVQHRWEIADD